MSIESITISGTETQASSSRGRISGLRFSGYALLVMGFLWLIASALIFPVAITAAASRHSDTLPRKEAYDSQEFYDAFWSFAMRVRREPPWIVTPAVLMFAGGLLLSRYPARPPTAEDTNIA